MNTEQRATLTDGAIRLVENDRYLMAMVEKLPACDRATYLDKVKASMDASNKILQTLKQLTNKTPNL